MIVGHIRVERGCVLLLVGNDLPDQLYRWIMLIPVLLFAPDDDLLQRSVGNGKEDRQRPGRCVGYGDKGGGISTGAESDLMHPVVHGNAEFSPCIRQLALTGTLQADTDIWQRKTGKGIKHNAGEDPGLACRGPQPQQGYRQYGDELFDEYCNWGCNPQRYLEPGNATQSAVLVLFRQFYLDLKVTSIGLVLTNSLVASPSNSKTITVSISSCLSGAKVIIKLLAFWLTKG